MFLGAFQLSIEAAFTVGICIGQKEVAMIVDGSDAWTDGLCTEAEMSHYGPDEGATKGSLVLHIGWRACTWSACIYVPAVCFK